MFNWCFIGAGKLAGIVAKQIQETGRHKVVSVYTRNFEKCQKFCEEYGGKAYEKVEDAINDPEVDGVYIVTTHNAHFKFAKMALDAGKPVLCEKAFTVKASETDELIAYAKEKNLYLAEAMWTWFCPAANKVKEWVDSEKIGKINRVRFTQRTFGINYAPRIADAKRAGGALLDITVYPITYAYRLFGYPEKIESIGIIENGIDTSEEIIFTYDDFKVQISTSLIDNDGELMTITGDKGTITSPYFHFKNKAILSNEKGEEAFSGPGPEDNTYIDEFDTVALEINEGLKESRMVPLKATSDIMHIMDEIGEQIGLYYDNLEE